MGSVFLARQLSLDRLVAVKIMSASWAADPVFVARFTREAYAAALLNHPNVVQIFDIGEHRGCRFFSMEYVPGRSLADVVRRDGKVTPETAVGYILQAARGLQHAHEHKLIHRDVKPENLLMSEQGIVKVADLGLVKTPNTAATLIGASRSSVGRRPLDETDSGAGLASLPVWMTGHRIALGTPAYMAPEQCRDAAIVDHRADIYSLGCTLYSLVTGKTPFDGESAVELMTQHAYEPVVPPDQVSPRVPKRLSDIILKMMEKDLDRRYQSMAEVVRVLEDWLGVYHTGRFVPGEHDIERVERYARIFNSAPSAVARNRAVQGIVWGCCLTAVMLAFFGRLDWAFGLAGLVLHAAGLYFVLNGVARRTYFFGRVNQFLAGLSPGDWAMAATGVGLFAVLMWGLGLLWVWVGFGFLGAGLAIAIRYGFDQTIDAERYVAVAKCERLAQKIRMAGIAEDDLREFVANYSGRQWEEFFEAVFGFEAKLATRTILARAGHAGNRERFASWREPIVALIDGVEAGRRAVSERRLMARVERARRAADPTARATGVVADPKAGPGHRLGRIVWSAAGIALIVCCLIWVAQNRPADRLGGLAPRAGNETAFVDRVSEVVSRPTTPLRFDRVPAAWTTWCNSMNVGLAGLILFAARAVRRPTAGVLVVLGAAVMILGHKNGIRTVDPIRAEHVALLLGVGFALLGIKLGQSADAEPGLETAALAPSRMSVAGRGA